MNKLQGIRRPGETKEQALVRMDEWRMRVLPWLVTKDGRCVHCHGSGVTLIDPATGREAKVPPYGFHVEWCEVHKLLKEAMA